MESAAMNDKAILEALAKQLKAPLPDAVRKAFVSPSDATSGLAEYDLEPGARLIYPLDTPLRNVIPRVVGGAGVQANYRSIVAVNSNNEAIGLSEGNRGGLNSYTEVDTYAKFVELGLDDYVTWKANAAAKGFENLDELAVQMLLQSTMEAEEKIILYGNSTTGLGTTPDPDCTPNSSGGTITNQSGVVVCVALTYRGASLSTVTAGVKVPYQRSNADGTQDWIYGFSAEPSSEVAATTTGSGAVNSITCTVTPVPGAAAYAWYYGLTGAANQKLVAITTINSVILDNPGTGHQALSALPATDKSQDQLIFDGLIPQMVNSATRMGAGYGSYIQALATGTAGTGTTLTSTGSGTGGIAEFDTAIESFFTTHRLIPDTIWISGADQKAIKALILNGNTNAAVFFQGNDGEIRAGARVKTYTNPIGYGNPDLMLKVHPFLPQGTVLFTTGKIPYPLSNVSQIWKMSLRRDYYSILWPLRSRKYEYGTYFDGVLQHYFPAAMGMIYNIAPS
jgi:hypothetical protein